ncbi:unnamed protein product, partial [Meganyctiphanes norvegica]
RALFLSCRRCDPSDCKQIPDDSCPVGKSKQGGCGCCDVCSKNVGEACGGLWGRSGRCGQRLKCQRKKDDRYRYAPGICVADWSPEADACIIGHNNQIVDDISLDDCNTRCLGQFSSAWVCKSLEYHSSSRRCSLSSADSNSLDYLQPCTNFTGWTFTEITSSAFMQTLLDILPLVQPPAEATTPSPSEAVIANSHYSAGGSSGHQQEPLLPHHSHHRKP